MERKIYLINRKRTRNGHDEGKNIVNNFTNYLKSNIPGYIGSIEEDVGNVMISYSSVNGIPMSISGYAI